ncbi:hypothetical protein AKJ09_11033 [Labilithrix luteola]|uniref:Uncharacterized protein n=1 Tax=Labilithrix luteola TaxID=1391654 RepID=A0A0K1QG16_9BACT|nr:hypothetical protein [Labilithrix luteola]AKV04370.1 hypothetical protein AKJ09_11033 [Labilithrix luteola]
MSHDPQRLVDVDATPEDRLLASLIEQHRQGRPDAAALLSLTKRLDAGSPLRATGRFFRLCLYGASAVACTALAVTAFRVAPPATPSPFPSPSSAPVATNEPPQGPATVSVHALPSEPASSASAAPPPPSRRVKVAAPETRETSDKICDESQLIERAETLLRTGQPAGALDITRQHVACGETVLVQERERIAIEALLKLRRPEEASARARAFEANYPSSPHIRRIRQLIELRSE